MNLFRLRHGKRNRQRGAAALEFALSTLILIPLMMGMIDFGYYFYMAVNVIEAQHAGLVAAQRTGVTDCSSSASAAQVALKATAQTNASLAVTNYLSANNLTTVLILSGNMPSCSNNPLNPTWTMTLVADFRPVLGRVMSWDKASPTSGYVRYTAKTLSVY